MPDKKNFMLRVDAELYKVLEKWAADDFRSVNGQIEYLLHKAIKDQGRLPKEPVKQNNKPK